MPSKHLIPVDPHRKRLLYNMRPKLVPPQGSMTTWVDMSEANTMRRHFEGPIRLTYTHILIKATAVALEEQPWVNAVWTARGIRHHGDIRIGVPVQVEYGFFPVAVVNPHSKPMPLIAQELAELAAEAGSNPPRSGILVRLPQTIATLAIHYLKNYPLPIFKEKFTFMLSNLGQWGLDRTIPVVTHYSAMLTPGRVADRVVAIDGVLDARPTVSLTLAYDCRLIDDVQASRFLRLLRGLMENPQILS